MCDSLCKSQKTGQQADLRVAHDTQSSALQGALVGSLALALGLYFAFHAVQGEYGLFSRVQIEADERALIVERDVLQVELAALENKTRRLSDDFLDLDLLEERARDVLGVIRPGELVIR